VVLIDNAGVQTSLVRRRSWLSFSLLIFLASSLHAQQFPLADALLRALNGTQASAVVLDQATGAVLAQAGKQRSALLGSAIKPLLLEYALEHGVVRADTEVYCRRKLNIAGRALPCTHPADQPVFTAERALAESCNTWFAEMGRRFSGEELDAALRQLGLPHQQIISASLEQRQLAVLGLQGVTVSPLQLAHAYRELLTRAPADGVVQRGLRGSVSYGMARPAAVSGIAILGKTGTASDPGEAWTHGWFAGAISNRLVIVVYVPHGDGGTAAELAQRFLANFGPEKAVR
jgi:cell division protein FtsI/penicillin-binding protein 2